MGPLHIRFPHRGTEFGGVDRINHTIAELLARQFEIVGDPRHAALQVCSHDWDAPAPPPRLFIDHGAFADFGFWTFTAPKLRRDDTILVASRVCEQVADRLFGGERPRLVRVPFGVDTSLFHPAEDRARRRTELAREALVPADGPLLLAVSTHSRRKNLHLAVRLLAEVRQRVPNARLALVGRPGEAQHGYARAIDELIRELGLSRQVHLVPPLPHGKLVHLMAASDLLIHLTTCRLENFGLVVAEALASGLPVVAADWGGLRDLVEHGATGYLARTWLTARGPRVDWRGAASAAARMLTDPSLRESLGRRAADSAQSRLGLVAFEQRLCAAVREILERGPGAEGRARLSPRGEDLMFATIQLHRKHPGVRSTSAEYRAMLALAPELCRWLTGPAATAERTPLADGDARAYPVVAFSAENGTLRVTDPAWEDRLAVTDEQSAVARAADGRPLAELAERLGRAAPNCIHPAQFLFEQGVLGPLDDSWPVQG